MGDIKARRVNALLLASASTATLPANRKSSVVAQVSHDPSMAHPQAVDHDISVSGFSVYRSLAEPSQVRTILSKI
jgi:hypothetical protein